jgi:hypothetical protein
MQTPFDEIARAIVGADTVPPPGLLGAIPDLVNLLRGAIDAGKHYPSRTAFREQLEELIKAAQVVRKAMVDPKIRDVLVEHTAERPLNQNQTYHGLKDIIDRAEWALTRLNSKSRGSHKFRPAFDETPDTKTLCALMIGVGWIHARREWPKYKNVDAQRACVLLWEEATGVERGGELSAWRKRLRDAHEYQDGWQAGRLAIMMGYETDKKAEMPKSLTAGSIADLDDPDGSVANCLDEVTAHNVLNAGGGRVKE